MEIDTMGFALGDTVRDGVTGLVGVISGVHQYLTGCARVTIQPPVGSDGKVPDGYGTDVLGLELVKAGPQHVVDRSRGGPRDDPHSRV